MWWDNQHPRVKMFPELEWIPNPGICRKHKPGSHKVSGDCYVGMQPFMDAADHCGEFREAKGE